MIESGQISEKDPVQNTVAKGTQGYNKKIYEVQAHAQNRGKSQRTMRKRATFFLKRNRSSHCQQRIKKNE